MKTLYLLRHAKAENASPSQDDHARVLSETGRGQAMRLGEYARRSGLALPDYGLCSTAARTRETLKIFTEAAQAAPQAQFTDKLYHASTGAMLEQIRRIPDTAARALLVGHNPGIHQLAAQLAGHGEERLLDAVNMAYAPCTLAVFELEGGWAAASLRTATLANVITPEALASAPLMGAA